MFWVDYHITDVCNLNCAYCSHFAPLVPQETQHKSIQQITADLTLLSKIQVENLTLMGGEPTLHPHLSSIMKIARNLFPNTKIMLTTNGTRADLFERWHDAIIENQIVVAVSIYPSCECPYEPLEKIKKIIPEHLVQYSEYVMKFGMNKQFLTNSEVATDEQILGCRRRYQCTQLKDGKLYLCHFTAQFNRLKSVFPYEIQFDLNGDEYIDLNGDVTDEDVDEFLKNVIPNFCKHCQDVVNNGSYGGCFPWKKTEKSIDEWMI